jgi:hypothetical protein
MTFREIFLTDTREAILLRGLIAVIVGVAFAAVVTMTTETNAFKRFAFPIFGVPALLTVLNLIGSRGRK